METLLGARMIRGHLTVAGDITVDGTDCTGVFIETTRDELKKGKVILYRDVEIRAASEAPAEQTGKNECHLTLQMGIVQCPTCGAECTIYSSGDGTNNYQPITPYREEGKKENNP